MNTMQRWVLVTGLGAISCASFYPPWGRTHADSSPWVLNTAGFHPIFSDRIGGSIDGIDIVTLGVLYIAIFSATAACFLVAGSWSSSSSERKS
jgi:hypothetical protein